MDEDSIKTNPLRELLTILVDLPNEDLMPAIMGKIEEWQKHGLEYSLRIEIIPHTYNGHFYHTVNVNIDEIVCTTCNDKGVKE